MRIARPILLVSTPVGVVFGLHEAWRLAGPAMAVLMAAMLAVVGGFMWMTVRTIRRERAELHGRCRALLPYGPGMGRAGIADSPAVAYTEAARSRPDTSPAASMLQPDRTDTIKHQ